jgi:hypothetical protein
MINLAFLGSYGSDKYYGTSRAQIFYVFESVHFALEIQYTFNDLFLGQGRYLPELCTV